MALKTPEGTDRGQLDPWGEKLYSWADQAKWVYMAVIGGITAAEISNGIDTRMLLINALVALFIYANCEREKADLDKNRRIR